MTYQDRNAKVIDSWVQNGWEWGKAIDQPPIWTPARETGTLS